jgi:hypothetical protein
MTTWFRCSILTAAGVAAIAAIAGIPRVSQFIPGSRQFASGDIPQFDNSGLRTGAAHAQVSQAAARPDNDADTDADAPDPSKPPAPTIVGDMSQPMKPEMKVDIIRFIDGEFGKAAKPLPGKTNGFTILVGKPIDNQSFRDALRLQGTAIGAGDPVQVTRLDFMAHKIVIQLNGGAKKKFHLMDHLQIGLGGDTDPGNITPTDGSGTHRDEGRGAVIVLDYGKPLPDVSPDDIKQELSALIDFSTQKSAAVNWVETLPPKFQDAVRDHKALAGMDQQTVIAAIGRPDKKVRETNQDGIESEDWIYGNPPAKTVFVTFIGEKVSRVEECGGPRGGGLDAAPTCAMR